MQYQLNRYRSYNYNDANIIEKSSITVPSAHLSSFCISDFHAIGTHGLMTYSVLVRVGGVSAVDEMLNSLSNP